MKIDSCKSVYRSFKWGEQIIKGQITRQKVISMAASLAAQESEVAGKDYYECIANGLDEACERFGVSRKNLIKMWMEG